MFSTFRSENLNKEVVCISSTNQPPQSGQAPSHFACDGCRAKKLKCTGHRFGCQRCRDRNIACVYSGVSQSKRRRSGKPRGSTDISVGRLHLPSPAIISAHLPTEHGSKQLGRSTNRTNLAPNTLASSEMESLIMTDEHKDLSHLPPTDELQDSAASTSDQLAILQGATDTSFDEWDMQFFGNDLLPSNSETSSTEPDSNSDSCDHVSEDLITIPDSLERLDAFHQSPDQTHHQSAIQTKTPCSCAHSAIHSPVISSLSSRVNADRSSFSTTCNSQSSPTKTRPVFQRTSQCRCMSMTLNILEKIHSLPTITSFRNAERSLMFLKESTANCHGLLHCQSCRSSTRLMTFSILLLEKKIGVLEGIANYWEARIEEGDGNDTVCFGEYQINSTHERCEVLGLLIILQVKRLERLANIFISRAEKKEWLSQYATLKPVVTRIRELRSTLEEMRTDIEG